MALELSALEPGELILLAVALVGLIPLVLRYNPESKWFAIGYGCILVSAIATNAEALAFTDALNVIEHGVGLMGAGIAFAYAAYHRRQMLLADSSDDIDGAEV